MTHHARIINRLADAVVSAEERGDTASAEFLSRCLESAIRDDEREETAVRMPLIGRLYA
jgi:hypothetical protein